MNPSHFFIVDHFRNEGATTTIEELPVADYPKGFTSYQGPFESREILLSSISLHPKLCSICGGLIRLEYINNDQLTKNCMCWHCNHWSRTKVDRNIVVIDGTMYSILPDNDKAFYKGFGGSRFVIKKDSGEIIVSHNVWCKGEVPFHFRATFPNNATFIGTNNAT